MHHKLQSSSSKNDGKNSVVRKQQAKPNRQKSRDLDAGARSGQNERRNSNRSSRSSTRDSRKRKQNSGSRRLAVVREREALGGKRQLLGQQPSLVSEPVVIARDREVLHKAAFLRCEVPHSAGLDPTGGRAFPCGARAEVICETCGPMCAACAQETFCQDGEHKLSPLPESEPEPVRKQPKRPVKPVIYVELKCPKRCRVRLALPQTHRVQSKRKCPVCKTIAPTKYLAHGFTRRQLPFHEVWTEEEDFIKGSEPTEDRDFKRRIPWDGREKKWEQNRRR